MRVPKSHTEKGAQNSKGALCPTLVGITKEFRK